MKTSSFLLCAGCVVAAYFFVVGPAAAKKVDLALVLLIDDSASIDGRESRMQLSGYAAAFRNPQVISAMTRGPSKSIAVSVVMFTDRVRVMIPWTVLDGKQTAEAFAARMQRLPRIFGAATHIGKGIEFSINHISRSPFEFYASTIDVSADGWDNQFAPALTGTSVVTGILGAVTGIQIGLPSGPDPVGARKLSELKNYAASRGITINCIAIEDPSLRDYFSQYVASGPSAFTMFAPSFRSFTEGIQRKLLREINDAVKLSTVRQKKATEVRKARAVSSPTPKIKKEPTPRSTPAKAAADSEPDSASASPPKPAALEGNASPGEVEQENAPALLAVEVAPPVRRQYEVLVRDAANEFPLDEVQAEPVGDTQILGITPPEGRPGLFLLEIETPAGTSPQVKFFSPLYLPKEVRLNEEFQEVLLERQRLRIVW